MPRNQKQDSRSRSTTVSLEGVPLLRPKGPSKPPAPRPRDIERWLEELPPTSPEPADYGAAFSQLYSRIAQADRALAVDKGTAPQRYRELLAQPQDRRRLLIRNAPRFQSWSLASLLLKEARAKGASPERSSELAEAALAVVHSLDRRRHGATCLRDLEGRIWACLGNARRVDGNLEGADAAFEIAELVFAYGSGDPLEKAPLLEARAHLAEDSGDSHQAVSLLDRAGQAYRRGHYAQGRIAVRREQAAVELRAGQLERANHRIRQALNLAEEEGDCQAQAASLGDLCLILCRQRNLDGAAEILPRLRKLSLQSRRRFDLLRLQRATGCVHLGRGRWRRGEACLVRACRGFLAVGAPYSAIASGLDLIRLYLVQERDEDAYRLLEALLPQVQTGLPDRSARAAILLLERAARRRELDIALLERLAPPLDRDDFLSPEERAAV